MEPEHPQLAQWRADTPGCTHCVHLNNAGSALMPDVVYDAMKTHLDLERDRGGYEAAAAARPAIEQAYVSVANLIGAKRANIAIVENATVAVAQALSAFDWSAGDTIITTRVDYSSNQLMLLSLAQRLGIRVVRPADLPEGGVDPDDLHRLIRLHRPRLLMMSWIPTNSGLIQDAHAVGALCVAEGVPFLLDACQAVGQLPIDVTTLQCDFLAATARKFLRGPRGLGWLYVSDRMIEQGRYPLYIDSHGAHWDEADHYTLTPDARRFENWEFPYALVLGLGAAADYAITVAGEMGMQRAIALAAYARTRLVSLPGVRVLDRGHHQGAIATFAFEGQDIPRMMAHLRTLHIHTSVAGRAFALLDMDDKQVAAALRVSPHYYNTTAEIETLYEALAAFHTTFV